MSVASKNPFAILDEGANSRPSSPAAAPKAPAPPAPVPARDNKKSTQKGPRGGQYYQRGGAKSSGARGEGNPNQNGVEEPESAPKKFDGGRGRSRGGRSRGGARGGRPDRHSQTGKTDSDKKIHQGWGGDEGKSELQAETAATVDAAVEQAGADAWGATTGDVPAWGATGGDASAWDIPAGEAAPAAAVTTEDKPERENRRREEEEEDNTLTLDQYLAQKKEKEALALPSKRQVRKANEGADGDIWKDAVAIQKGGEEDAYFVGKNKAAAPKTRAKKEEKVFIEIEGRFERPARGSRGRGDGRGGRGRGEGRRGGARGGRQSNGPSQTSVNVDDEAAFPSLS
ncbi:hypothetical protein J3R30DRAFT_3445207 [Lentinula aciculospora]|uniref:Hyaluronan/mRNA-binding protein domain-containing protein n=1 Tax=Lentinula aciculospora TaxID=153920 RepID=A0A9W9DU30_9AGAR|nr:hypothetical protein J3R30DRAFT_3445207 [Lentinula aciculospora]